jgi:hypothetical protein
MFCIYCGTNLPDNAGFCHKCGKRQSVAANLPTPSISILSGSVVPEASVGDEQLTPGTGPMVQGPPIIVDSTPAEYLPPSAAQPALSSSAPLQAASEASQSPSQHPSGFQPPLMLPPTQVLSGPSSSPLWPPITGSLSQWQSPTEPQTQWMVPQPSPSQLQLQASTGSQLQRMLPQSLPLYPPSPMQRLLVQVFQPVRASNAFFGAVLGALVAAIGGAFLAGIYLACAHALVPQDLLHIANVTDNETVVDIMLGILPLHSPLRESLQLFLIMHGVGTTIQVSAAYAQISGAGSFTFIRPLNGLLFIPALLLTLGGYISASTDFANHPRTSLLRGAAIALPYTLVLFILLLIVDGTIPVDYLQTNLSQYLSSAVIATLNMDGLSLLAFGLLWGALFGALGASLKLARGQWRHLLFRFLHTNRYARVSSMITGAFAATGVGVSLSLLVLCCSVVFIALASSPLVAGSSGNPLWSWQPLLLLGIAYVPLLAVNLFLLSFGAPVHLTTACSGYNSLFSSLCTYSSGTHVTLAIFGSTPKLPEAYSPWIYALLAIPAISLFLGGRVSAHLSDVREAGAAAWQGALIAVPFTLLMMVLTSIVTATVNFTLTATGSGDFSSGNFSAFTLTAGVGAFDLFLWALLFGAVFGALGGAYQASAMKAATSRFLMALAVPFKTLSRSAYYHLDRLAGLPPTAQRSAIQNAVYGTFLCTLCLLIAAGIVGGLLIVLNQEISLVANQRILSIGSAILVALPCLFLLSACASALRRDPQAPQDSTPSRLM